MPANRTTYHVVTNVNIIRMHTYDDGKGWDSETIVPNDITPEETIRVYADLLEQHTFYRGKNYSYLFDTCITCNERSLVNPDNICHHCCDDCDCLRRKHGGCGGANICKMRL